MPSCAGFLEPRKSRLGPSKSISLSLFSSGWFRSLGRGVSHTGSPSPPSPTPHADQANPQVPHAALHDVDLPSSLSSVKIYVQCWKFHTQLLHVYLNWFQRNSHSKSVSQPKIQRINKNPYFSIQGHPMSLNSVAIESQCTISYQWLIVT